MQLTKLDFMCFFTRPDKKKPKKNNKKKTDERQQKILAFIGSVSWDLSQFPVHSLSMSSQDNQTFLRKKTELLLPCRR